MAASSNNPGVFPMLLFGIMFALLIAWFFMIAHLFKMLRNRHSAVYNSLGSPRLFLNNNIRNNIAVARFLMRSEFLRLNDPPLIKHCRMMRGMFCLYVPICLTFFAIAIGEFSSRMHQPPEDFPKQDHSPQTPAVDVR